MTSDVALMLKQLRELGYKGLHGDETMWDPAAVVAVAGKEKVAASGQAAPLRTVPPVLARPCQHRRPWGASP